MNIIAILGARSKYFYAFIFLLGAMSSVLDTGILMFINFTITQRPLPIFPEYDWAMFIGVMLISLFIGRAFQVYMIKLSNELLYDFEKSILERLRFASHEAFEKLGTERVYTGIGDARSLSQVPGLFISFTNSFVVTLCTIGYMFWISWIGALMVLAIMAFLVVFYVVRNRMIEKDLNQLRDLQNTYHKYIKDFLFGFKETKMSVLRNDNLYEKHLKQTLHSTKTIGITSSIKYMNNELTGAYSWYIVLGVVLFALPKFTDMVLTDIITFIVAILYIGGPVAALIATIPSYTRIKIALERLAGLNNEIDGTVNVEIKHGTPLDVKDGFKKLSFTKVSYEYYDKQGLAFKMGPINFEVNKGEVIFITGGNGSGKSTFINILTGLYQSNGGTIHFNDEEITSHNLPRYRDEISAIFTDNYMFKDNYDDFDLVIDNEELKEYLDKMKLSSVVRFESDDNFISNDLSKGQQKRLAMVYAMLEDREVVVLDEWAAEQDPESRKYFYEVLIPELKAKGKTIIAITHDDTYYSCADRIVKFDYGKIVYDQKNIKEEQQITV